LTECHRITEERVKGNKGRENSKALFLLLLSNSTEYKRNKHVRPITRKRTYTEQNLET
jgi:hypothetical protein